MFVGSIPVISDVKVKGYIQESIRLRIGKKRTMHYFADKITNDNVMHASYIERASVSQMDA